MHRPANNPARVQVQHCRHVEPTLCRPDVGTVSHPFLIRRIGLEMAIQNVTRDRTALPAVLRSTRRLGRARKACSRMSRSMRCKPQLWPRASTLCHTRPVGPVATQETLTHQRTQDFICLAALAPRPYQPRIKATARDTERLANQSHRPAHSVLRHEVELHIDSLAK